MSYLIAYGIFLMAIMSPGPDTASTLQNALISRRHGIACALGIGLGNLLHIGLASTVLGVFLARYPLAYIAMQLFAGGYLLYLAYKSYTAPVATDLTAGTAHVQRQSETAALREGFLICLANPKAIMFWLSFFSATVAGLGTSFTAGVGRYVFIAALVLSVTGWFTLVAMFFSIDRVRERFLALERPINIAVAIIFALIGIGLLWSVAESLPSLTASA